MKSRLLVAAVGVPLLLWVILWAPVEVLAVFLEVLAAIAAWELLKCVGVDMKSVLASTTMVGAVFSVASAYTIQSDVMQLRWATTAYPILAVIYVLILFGYAVCKAGEVKFLHICTALFCMFAIPYAFTGLLRLYSYGYHRAFLLLPLIFSFCSDTFAFFAGLTLGKHKLAPKVSPKKTVEGAVGGLAGSVVGGLVFAWVMNTWFGQSIPCVGIAVLGLGCSVIAQLGDLSFSLIKREFGIKDYGKLFLAHGGVLDRFDSVLFVTPVLAILMPWLL